MPKPLPHKIFLTTFRYAPRVAVNLLIQNKAGQFILTRRAIKPYKGTWHLPGAFLLKNETIAACLKRILKKELGISQSLKPHKLLGVYENLKGDPRGHVIDVAYQFTLNSNILAKKTSETSEVQWFKSLPAKIGFNQAGTIRTALKYF